MNDDDADDKPKPLAWRDHYFDPKANEMTMAAVKETDPKKRDQMYAELQKKITDEGPYILMFQPLTPVATREREGLQTRHRRGHIFFPHDHEVLTSGEPGYIRNRG